jgi:hypothetical protein
MSRSHPAILLSCLIALCLAPAASASASSGTAATGFRVGENSTEGFIDFLIPLYAAGDGFGFVNPVFSLGEGGENEINLGAGWRQLTFDGGMLLGGNVYFDSRLTEYDHRFNQVGFGVEVLSRWIDARANYYLPEEKELIGTRESTTVDTRTESTVTDTSTWWGDPYATDHAILQDRNTSISTRTSTTTTTTRRLFEQYESSMEGFDAEVGVLLPLPADLPQARLFGGYYSFDDPYGERIEGPKGRVEVRIGVHLMLDAEFFDDDRLNDTRFFAGARLHAPFDLAALFSGSNPFAAGAAPAGSSSQASRMTEMVIRDMRVQMATSPFVEDPEAMRVTVAEAEGIATRFSAETFTLLDDVTFVDDDNTGGVEDGTAEHPFDIIQEGVDASFGKKYVYVFDGDYSSVSLLAGVTLWGEGTAVPGFGGKQFGGMVYPTIGGASPAVTVTGNTRVTGFHIVNSEDHGIFGEGLTGSVVIDNNIIDVATAFDDGWVSGIHLLTDDATVTIAGNVITSTGGPGNGIYLDNFGSLVATISGNTILSDGVNNYGIFGWNDGNSMTVAMTGNSVVSAQSYGVEFGNSGQDMYLTLTGNTIRTDSVEGLASLVIFNGGMANSIQGAAGPVVTADIAGNTLTVTGGFGSAILLENQQGALDVSATGNTFNLASDTTAVSTFNYGTADFTFNDNTLNTPVGEEGGPTVVGFRIRNLFGDQTLTATGNLVVGEVSLGFYLWNPDGPLPQGTFAVSAAAPGEPGDLSDLNGGVEVWYLPPGGGGFTFLP